MANWVVVFREGNLCGDVNVVRELAVRERWVIFG
jgi:hypothetical protein